MSNAGKLGAILTDNQTLDGETVGGIHIIGSSYSDTTSIYGGMPAPGDFLTYTDTFNIDATGLSGVLNLFGGYGPIVLEAMVNDTFTITNVGARPHDLRDRRWRPEYVRHRAQPE